MSTRTTPPPPGPILLRSSPFAEGEIRNYPASGYRKPCGVIPAFLLGKKGMPPRLPEYIGFGDENEVVSYVGEYASGRKKTPGVLEWLAARPGELASARVREVSTLTLRFFHRLKSKWALVGSRLRLRPLTLRCTTVRRGRTVAAATPPLQVLRARGREQPSTIMSKEGTSGPVGLVF